MIIKIGILLITIIAIILFTAMFTPKKYTLSREIVVNKSNYEVFDYLKLNRNQISYSKWLSFDPNTKIELRGAEDGTSGSILAFESKDRRTGKGEWEIKKIIDNKRIEFELRFLEPFAFIANGYFLIELINDNQTKITWIYNSGMDWPMNFMLIFLNMDKLVGNDIQASLENIKNSLENDSKTNTVN